MRQVIDCLCKGIKSRMPYPPSVRAFCMSLHFISPRAYEYLRKKFGKNIPHVQTIRQWYRNSYLDASSGISEQALNTLEIKAKNMLENDGKQLIITVIFDEMHIQRNMSWCRATNKFVGLIDIGTHNENEEFTLAKDVIVFMVSSMNTYFQLPIAFYFIQSLTGKEKADLLIQITTEISKRGIKVAAVTFDGHSSNVNMCQRLGAKLTHENPEYEPFFLSP